MKLKLRNLFSEIASIAKIQPLIFVTMLFNIIYGIITLIVGAVELSYYIGTMGIYSSILGITKYYALQKYKAVQTPENDIQEIEKSCAKNIAICAAAMSFLLFSFAIVSTFFYDEPPSNYGLWFIFFVAGSAFIKIILATINSIRTRKNHSIIIHHIKLTDNANALIALGLTQRAILYFTAYECAKLISGVGGAFFSICALGICLSMFIKTKRK